MSRQASLSLGAQRKTRRKFLRSDRHSFWEEIRRIRYIATVTALIVLSTFASRIWTFEYAGLRSQEILQRAVPAVPAVFTRIVFITPDDYREEFNERLESAALDKAIDRISDFNPAVIVVDLDTSSRRFQKLKTRPEASPSHPRIVWARDAEELGTNNELAMLLPVRGTMDSAGIFWGLALFPRSPDWTVRLYPRMLTVGTARAPSLHWQAVSQFCSAMRSRPDACRNVQGLSGGLRRAGTRDEELMIPVLHARYEFEPWRLGDILAPLTPGPTPPVAPINDLSDKIVLLGGAYSPQDRHQTPFGFATGVEIVANAVEAELAPQGRREMQEFTQVTLKIILAVLIAGIHHFFRPFHALWLTTGLLAFLVFFGSVAAALFAGYRADFVPFLVGILIEQLYTSAETAERNVGHRRSN
jgi:hypothetical protein